jgi:hypothetical protein
VCPECITALVLMVAGASSTGGLAAFGVKQLRAGKLGPIIQSKGEQDGHTNADEVRPPESSVPS